MAGVVAVETRELSVNGVGRKELLEPRLVAAPIMVKEVWVGCFP